MKKHRKKIKTKHNGFSGKEAMKAGKPSSQDEAKAIRKPRREEYFLIITLALAFSIRLTYFFLNKHNNPLFYHPIMDSLYHDEWAKRIISGDLWGHEVFFRAPLYPYFLALLYKISGSSIAFAKFFQNLLGTASVALIYYISRTYFKPVTSFIAALLAATYWPLIYFEGQLLIVTFAIFLDLLFLLLLSRSLRNKNLPLLFASGLVLGLSAIARPSILIFIFVLPIVFLCHSKARSGKLSARIWRRWAMKSAVIIAGSAVAILPVIVRNYVVGHDFVPIASQGGVNFFIGNNPESDGRTAIVPGTRPDWWGGYYDAINIAEKSEGRKLKPSEVSNYYFRRGFSFVLSSPHAALKLFLHKLRIFWSAGERANNKNIYFFWRRSGMGSVPLPGFWLICPLGLLGAVLLWPRRAELSALYLFAASYSMGVIVFFVNARFRLPVVPILIIFGAYSVHFLVESYRRKSGAFAKALLILLVFAAAVNADLVTFKENKVYADAFSHYTLGNAYLKMGKGALALREYEKAYENQQRFHVTSYYLIARNVDYNLGTLYYERGRCREAIQHFRNVGGGDKYAVIAKRHMAECYAKTGALEEAFRSYNEALRIDPSDRRSLIGLSKLYIKIDKKDEAKKLLHKASSFYPGDMEIRKLLDGLFIR